MKLEIKGGKFLLIAADGAKVSVLSAGRTVKAAILITDEEGEITGQVPKVDGDKVGCVFLNGAAEHTAAQNDWVVQGLQFLGYKAEPKSVLSALEEAQASPPAAYGKRFSDTTAFACRYGDVAATVWGDWNVLWEDSEADYQGHASFLAEKDGQHVFYEWWYGSCSGCDTWEAASFTDEQVAEEMKRTAAVFKDRDHLVRWLSFKDDGKVPISNHADGGICGKLDCLTGGFRDRFNGMRKAVGLPLLSDNEPEQEDKQPGRPKKENV